jgi:hypothetical protein
MIRIVTCGFQIVGAIVLMSAASVYSFGQTEPNARENERDLDERIFNLSLLRKGKSTDKHSDSQAILAQVQADFTRLQVVNNDLAETIDRKPVLDLDIVVKSAAEINNLAEKLMSNLTQTKSGKNTKEPAPETLADREQLKQLLGAIDKVIVSFTHNPVFKEATPDDEKLGKQALRDLDQIIQLSSHARKSAEKLLKETQPTSKP